MMLLTAILVLGAFLCWLLFSLAVNALPFYVGLSAGIMSYQSGSGLIAATTVGSVASSATYAAARLVANTLGDLTNRQNRYGHQPWGWPHDARFWGRLGLPTLRECTFRVVDVNLATGARTPRTAAFSLNNSGAREFTYEWPFPFQASYGGTSLPYSGAPQPTGAPSATISTTAPTEVPSLRTSSR